MPRFIALSLPLVIGLSAACSNPPPAESPNAPENTPSEAAVPPGTEGASAPAGNDPAESPSDAPSPETTPADGPKDTRGKEEIQRVMADNRHKVRACYDAALKDNPGIKGDLVVSFVINPEGDVKTAEVNWSESELHVPELDTCAVEAVKSFKFPASSRGLESKVNYPFNFNPAPPDTGSKKPPSGPSTAR